VFLKCSPWETGIPERWKCGPGFAPFSWRSRPCPLSPLPCSKFCHTIIRPSPPRPAGSESTFFFPPFPTIRRPSPRRPFFPGFDVFRLTPPLPFPPHAGQTEHASPFPPQSFYTLALDLGNLTGTGVIDRPDGGTVWCGEVPGHMRQLHCSKVPFLFSLTTFLAPFIFLFGGSPAGILRKPKRCSLDAARQSHHVPLVFSAIAGQPRSLPHENILRANQLSPTTRRSRLGSSLILVINQ